MYNLIVALGVNARWITSKCNQCCGTTTSVEPFQDGIQKLNVPVIQNIPNEADWKNKHFR